MSGKVLESRKSVCRRIEAIHRKWEHHRKLDSLQKQADLAVVAVAVAVVAVVAVVVDAAAAAVVARNFQTHWVLDYRMRIQVGYQMPVLLRKILQDSLFSQFS